MRNKKTYNNDDYAYTDENGYYHLIIDGKDVLEGKKVEEYHSDENGDYEHRGEDEELEAGRVGRLEEELTDRQAAHRRDHGERQEPTSGRVRGDVVEP